MPASASTARATSSGPSSGAQWRTTRTAMSPSLSPLPRWQPCAAHWIGYAMDPRARPLKLASCRAQCPAKAQQLQEAMALMAVRATHLHLRQAQLSRRAQPSRHRPPSQRWHLPRRLSTRTTLTPRLVRRGLRLVPGQRQAVALLRPAQPAQRCCCLPSGWLGSLWRSLDCCTVNSTKDSRASPHNVIFHLEGQPRACGTRQHRDRSPPRCGGPHAHPLNGNAHEKLRPNNFEPT
mmetsp:Transcript_5848/g.18769  ORF Transcript_5848/g.18769 Transcript_5848/m.18769 type:complete len:235 (+) Transcript_5848:1750-2454(+)